MRCELSSPRHDRPNCESLFKWKIGGWLAATLFFLESQTQTTSTYPILADARPETLTILITVHTAYNIRPFTST